MTYLYISFTFSNLRPLSLERKTVFIHKNKIHKFDNFKDEKMSDCKTASAAQSKNLLDRKPAGLTNYELLLRAFFYVFWGKKKILLKIL